jgi:predicted DNA-binding transcriptional regulator AlpA
MQTRVPFESRRQSSSHNDDDLITTKRLREMLGDCSEMHIWRLTSDPNYLRLRFPKPIKINRRKYFRLAQVRSWIKRQDAA